MYLCKNHKALSHVKETTANHTKTKDNDSKSRVLTCKDITGYRRPTRTSSKTDDLPDFKDEIMK